jgi:hypothetical protein
MQIRVGDHQFRGVDDIVVEKQHIDVERAGTPFYIPLTP